MRVKVVTNKMPTLIYRTLNEDSTLSSREREVQLHKLGFKLRVSTRVRIYNFAHSLDSEQTLMDYDADSDYKGITGPDFTLIKPSLSLATRLKIDKPIDSHREQK